LATPVIMPKLGFDVEQAKLIRWVKHEGDQVEKGEVVAEVETEKVTLEVEVYASGTLIKIVAPEGAVVPVGQTIAYLGAAGEQVAAEAPPAPPPPPPEETPAPPAAPEQARRLRVSPVAEALARARGVDLAQVTGTGPGGRITKDDVLAYLQKAEQPPPPPAQPSAEEPTPMRRAIARKMTESKPGIPHFYVTMQVDMSRALELRQQLNQDLPEQEQISVNDLAIKALALALAQFPDFNAWYLEGRLQRQEQVNIGLAIALEDGLIAPAVLDCAAKTLHQISREAQSLAARARQGRLSPEEFAQATITVSNLGMFGVDLFQAIIVPPQIAILALGAARPLPVAGEGGEVAVRQVMSMTLSADHRATDGAVGARMLSLVRELLEHPARLLS